jgi:hypothetical protein
MSFLNLTFLMASTFVTPLSACSQLMINLVSRNLGVSLGAKAEKSRRWERCRVEQLGLSHPLKVQGEGRPGRRNC